MCVCVVYVCVTVCFKVGDEEFSSLAGVALLVFIFTLTESLTFIESRMVQSSKGKTIHHVTKIPRKCFSELAAPFCKGGLRRGGWGEVFLMGGKKVGMHGSVLIMNICCKY